MTPKLTASRRSGHRLGAFFLGIVLVATAACAAPRPPPVVITQASPNPLVGVKTYAVAAVTFDGLTMEGMPEAQWLATRTPRQQDSWAHDKEDLTRRLLERFRIEARSDESFVPVTGALQPGQFALEYHMESFAQQKFQATLRVRDAQGALVDEVRLQPQALGGGIAYALSMWVVSTALDSLSYLRSRYAPATQSGA